MASELVEYRLDKNGRRSYGERSKRILFKGIPCDIFSVLPPADWGVILALRTGPAEFSHKLVSPKPRGYLQPGCYVKDGGLFINHKRIYAESEKDVFDAIGLEWLDPKDRK